MTNKEKLYQISIKITEAEENGNYLEAQNLIDLYSITLREVK